jgi:hypothetical protein
MPVESNGSSSRSGVSWATLIILASFGASVGLGTLWVGGVSRQVEIDSQRIAAIEHHDADTRDRELKIITEAIQRDADLSARISVLEALMRGEKSK